MDFVLEKFRSKFNTEATIVVRCPGRVNLIGEHIDYMGYGVLPMAIEEATWIAAAASDEQIVHIASADSKYPELKMSLPSSWSGASPPQWYDYVLCGWKGIQEKLQTQQKGFKMLLTGTVPESSGLSSSSSVVCAAALTTFAIQTGKDFDAISRTELAELCAKNEQCIGVAGGGMDQACEVLSQEGKALRIDFNPLTSREISLPAGAQFVVLHSGVRLNKAATNQYNQRVAECRVAGKLLLKHLGLPIRLLRLKQVQEEAGKSLEEMVKLTEILPEHLSRAAAEELLGADEVAQCLNENTKDLTEFVLRPRARHVYSEALRVQLFEDACNGNDIEAMGKHMNDSHTSCSKDYDCSCPELDELVELCRSTGAKGARLTGAGWGGCVVALADAKLLSHLPQFLFATNPSTGIAIYHL